MTFNVFGVKFELSYFFLSALTVFIAIDKTGMFLPMMVSILIHEFCHILFLKLYKCKITKLSLKIGTVGIRYQDRMSISQKIITLSAGPASNLIICIITYLLRFYSFSAINLILFLYNILPIKGLDGGELVYSLIQKNYGLSLADKVQTVLSITLIIVFIVIFILMYLGGVVNYSLLLFCIYLTVTLF